MNKIIQLIICSTLLTLTACAGFSNNSGKTQVYGEIKGGIEHTHVNR